MAITSTHTHMGSPPSDYKEEWTTHTIHVHGFGSLPAVRGVGIYSLLLLGNQWRLRIYPGGHDDAAEGMVTLDLWNKSNKAIEIDLVFSVNDGMGSKWYMNNRTVHNILLLWALSAAHGAVHLLSAQNY
jgi:hypothetical protein